jgi:hypothetical protein
MSARNSFGCALFFLFSLATLGAQQAPSSWQTEHIGRVQDFTARHVTVSGGLTSENISAAQTEPRVLLHLNQRALLERTVDDSADFRPQERQHPRDHVVIDGGSTTAKRSLKVDWSVSLGNGFVAPNMSPAKYGFNVNGLPSCTNDWVVYALNVNGKNKGQANLVGINNLYSGNPTGLCGTAPTVYWAYNGSTNNGSVLTSPTLSLDGTKIAYVESAKKTATFHVLTWAAGEGTVTNSVTPSNPPNCAAGSSCLVSVQFASGTTDTYASPWVDYGHDKVYVASDDGKIYRISCAFHCPLNTNPTVDWTYTLPVTGTGGADPQPGVTVYNSNTGYLFVGDQLGEMWTISAAGSTPSLYAGPVMVGGGGCTTTNPPGRNGTPHPCTASGAGYGIGDAIITDVSTNKVFAFSGNDGTGAVVKQMGQDLTGVVRVAIGQGGVRIQAGAFDNNYWGNNPNTGELFVCGTGPADNTPYHYWIGFSAYPTIDSTPTGSIQRLAGANGVPCTPYTEFYNPNLNLGGVSGDHDLLISGLVDPVNGYIITDDISGGAVTSFLNHVQYPGGVSGIVIDNDSAAAQASSIYFSTQGKVTVGTCNNQNCAVKLTQSSLQ